MKRLLIILLLLTSVAHAYDYKTLPNTFATRQIISSSKVQANDQAPISALSDGDNKANLAELYIRGVRVIDDDRNYYGGTMTLTGNATFTEAVTVNSLVVTTDLTVSDETSLTTLTVSGVSTFNNDVVVTGDIAVSGTVDGVDIAVLSGKVGQSLNTDDAVTFSSVSFNVTQTRNLIIQASEMVPLTSLVSWNYTIPYWELSNADTVRYLGSGVHLPNGAIVTSVVWYFHSAVTTGRSDCQLYGLNPTNTLTPITLANNGDVFSASGYLSTTDPSITNATIDNDIYGYFLLTGPYDSDGAAIKALGAKITYTVDVID